MKQNGMYLKCCGCGERLKIARQYFTGYWEAVRPGNTIGGQINDFIEGHSDCTDLDKQPFEIEFEEPFKNTQNMSTIVFTKEENTAEEFHQMDEDAKWEQRRYEIAKKMLPFIAGKTMDMLQGGAAIEGLKNKSIGEFAAELSIDYADKLIEALRK